MEENHCAVIPAKLAGKLLSTVPGKAVYEERFH
jgi:hypothetical protein